MHVFSSNMLKPYTPSANLRSSSKGLLTIPSVKLVNYGERSFSYAAPKLWNELPEYIRKSETLPIFKTRLKTHLFKQYYELSYYFNKTISNFIVLDIVVVLILSTYMT
jgi:hypothetical protein